MIHHSGPHHIQAEVEQAAGQMRPALDQRRMVPVAPEGPLRITNLPSNPGSPADPHYHAP